MPSTIGPILVGIALLFGGLLILAVWIDFCLAIGERIYDYFYFDFLRK